MNPVQFQDLRTRHPDLGDLSDNQFTVVHWCWEHGKVPPEAVDAGLISSATLSRWGGQQQVMEWVAAFNVNAPKFGAEVGAALADLVPDALRFLQDALASGNANKAVLDTAKYILDMAAQAAPPVPAAGAAPGELPSAEAELASVLTLVGG